MYGQEPIFRAKLEESGSYLKVQFSPNSSKLSQKATTYTIKENLFHVSLLNNAKGTVSFTLTNFCDPTGNRAVMRSYLEVIYSPHRGSICSLNFRSGACHTNSCHLNDLLINSKQGSFCTKSKLQHGFGIDCSCWDLYSRELRGKSLLLHSVSYRLCR